MLRMYGRIGVAAILLAGLAGFTSVGEQQLNGAANKGTSDRFGSGAYVLAEEQKRVIIPGIGAGAQNLPGLEPLEEPEEAEKPKPKPVAKPKRWPTNPRPVAVLPAPRPDIIPEPADPAQPVTAEAPPAPVQPANETPQTNTPQTPAAVATATPEPAPKPTAKPEPAAEPQPKPEPTPVAKPEPAAEPEAPEPVDVAATPKPEPKPTEPVACVSGQTELAGGPPKSSGGAGYSADDGPNPPAMQGAWNVTDGSDNCGCSVQFTGGIYRKDVARAGGCVSEQLRSLIAWKIEDSGQLALFARGISAPVALLRSNGQSHFSGNMSDGTPITLWR